MPRFTQEGKKYATIAVGCTGGRHRSVHIIERLALNLGNDEAGWRLHIAHRELAREGLSAHLTDRSARTGAPGSRRLRPRRSEGLKPTP